MSLIRSSKSATILAIAALACLLVAGCTAPPPAPVDSSATVEALLPTMDPPTPAATETEPAVAATDSTPGDPASTDAAPMNAASPPLPTATDAPASPTYTPRPPPTYTPRPAPESAADGERPPAILFQAELVDGTVLDLADTYGTPTLLAFWAPW